MKRVSQLWLINYNLVLEELELFPSYVLKLMFHFPRYFKQQRYDIDIEVKFNKCCSLTMCNFVFSCTI